MAFMWRGGFPSMQNNNSSDIPDDKNKDNENLKRKYYDEGYWYRRGYNYITIDKSYLAMEMILVLIILITGAITLFITYKTTIIDPIEHTKRLFVNMYLVAIGILMVAILVVNFLSKEKEILIKRLFGILAVSIMAMLIFLIVKLDLDEKYNENRFEQYYIEQNVDQETNSKVPKSKIDVSITGMGIKTEKEYYISECLRLYKMFNAKVYVILGINILLDCLIIYQIYRIYSVQEKKKKLSKDDLIFYEKEEN